VTQNYLGTQTNLTGIPSLLLSGLQNVQDKTVQTALYQIQNWANSFYPWNYAIASGSANYTTGGVVVDFANPFPDTPTGVAFGVFDGSDASQAQITALSATSMTVALYTPSGTELAAGSTWAFSYISVL